MPKQTIRTYAYNDEDDDESSFDAPRHPTRKQKGRAYQKADSTNEFPPVRVANSSKTANAKKGLGAPIITDERLAELDDIQLCQVIDFMTGAKEQRGKIMAAKGHREAIFSDIVLREMALELPMDLDEMRAIPGIKPEMVDRYGKRFLPLITNTRELYDGNVPRRRYLKPFRRGLQDFAEIENDDNEVEDEDEVMDPNHVNIIDLCSDGEAPPVAEESDSNYFDSDDDEDDDGEAHISHHFTQQKDPEVEAFNSRMNQLGPAVPKTASASRAPTSRGGSKVPGTRQGKATRRNGSGSFGKSFGGVKKRTAKASGSRPSGGASSTKNTAGAGRKGGGQGGGGTLPQTWGSVMAMPT